MTLSDAIATSRERSLNFADVEALLAASSGDPADALDVIALEIARGYADRQLDFNSADAWVAKRATQDFLTHWAVVKLTPA